MKGRKEWRTVRTSITSAYLLCRKFKLNVEEMYLHAYRTTRFVQIISIGGICNTSRWRVVIYHRNTRYPCQPRTTTVIPDTRVSHEPRTASRLLVQFFISLNEVSGGVAGEFNVHRLTVRQFCEYFNGSPIWRQNKPPFQKNIYITCIKSIPSIKNIPHPFILL